MTMNPAEVVAAAIERFSAGDDAGFVDAFAPDAIIWTEPQLSQAPVLSGREQIAAWCREVRTRWSTVQFGHGDLLDIGAGAYVELDVITDPENGGGAWRLPTAVFVHEGRVVEVLPQPDRETALAVLASR